MSLKPNLRRASKVIAAAVLAMGTAQWALAVPQPDATSWDGYFSGVDSAADNVPNWLRWDSAIDDDWTDPNDSFRLNSPSPGYMSVDRVTNSADHGKTGNIWIRDPILQYSLGFTMEIGVQIQPTSN